MHIATHDLVAKLTKFILIERDWNLSRPELIFNITGTARPMNKELPDDPIDAFKTDWPQRWFYKRLKDYITEVIFGLAGRKRSCWIMDGGTNAGIMRLLGAMHKEHFHNKLLHSPNEFPLIGFSDLSMCQRDSFPEFSKFDENFCIDGCPVFQHMEHNFQQSYEPDKDHTHHVFVHSKGLKCDSLSSKDASKANPKEHHFLLRQILHLSKEFNNPQAAHYPRSDMSQFSMLPPSPLPCPLEHATNQHIINAVGSLGPQYAAYVTALTEQRIDGPCLVDLLDSPDPDDFNQFLIELGAILTAHRTRLKRFFNSMHTTRAAAVDALPSTTQNQCPVVRRVMVQSHFIC